MGVDLSAVPLKFRRAIEAELALRVYTAALPRLGEAAALELLNSAIDEAAHAAGRAFADKAPQRAPSLAHFSEVLLLWQAGGALTIEEIECGGEALHFKVTRCEYVELYREMGLPLALHSTLSCRRDAAFAEGYSSKLRLDRPQTISDGAAACLFRFRWEH